jgi:hypothetical protein
MTKRNGFKATAVDYHRNGVSGEGFYVVLFRSLPEIKQGVAIYFPSDHSRCAVLDVEQTAAGNVAFARGNSWRGDHYSDEVLAAINAQRLASDLPTIEEEYERG